MLGRPKKNIIKAPNENNSQVSRIGRQIKCSNCQGVGHNKARCNREIVPKPPIVKRVIGRRREADLQTASSRGGRGGGSGVMGAGRDDIGGGMSGGRGTRGVLEEKEVVAGEQKVVVEDQEVVAK
nr:splicing factor [Tanacetum cinerariifolium]